MECPVRILPTGIWKHKTGKNSHNELRFGKIA